MKFSQVILFFTCLTYLFLTCNGENILVVLPMCTKSHHYVFTPLVEELARRNHTITFVSMLEPSKTTKNVDYIVVESGKDFSKKWSEWMSGVLSNSFSPFWMMDFGDILDYGCEALYNDQKFQQFRNYILKNNIRFDAVIAMPVISECYLSWVGTLGSPLILISPSVVLQNTAWILNIPYPLSFVAMPVTPFNSTMTFKQRLINVIASFTYLTVYKYYFIKRAEKIARKYVENSIPPLDVLSNASLLLVNSHFSLDEPKPIVPHVIDVGGMHCRPGNNLPKATLELQMLNNESEEVHFPTSCIHV